jgi:hypothetical protein
MTYGSLKFCISQVIHKWLWRFSWIFGKPANEKGG